MNRTGPDSKSCEISTGSALVDVSRRTEAAHPAGLIIEPDRMRALGLESILVDELSLDVVSAAAELQGAIAGLPENSIIKYVVLSISKPIWTMAVEWAELRWLFHLSEFIVLVSAGNRDSLLAAFASRAGVLLPYDCTSEDFRAGLRDLKRGRNHWDSGLMQVVSDSLIETGLARMQAPSTPQPDPSHFSGRSENQDGELAILTVRERDVLEGLAEGRTNRELSESLNVAERTVAFHITNLYSKLNARSRTELGMRGRCAICRLDRDQGNLSEFAAHTS